MAKRYTIEELKNLFVVDSFIKGSSTFKSLGNNRFELATNIDVFEIRNLTRGYSGESENLEKIMQEIARKLHIKEFENNNLRIKQYIENVLKDLDTPEANKLLRDKETIDALVTEYSRGNLDMDSIETNNLANLYDSKFAQLSNEVLKHRRMVQQQERLSVQQFEANKDLGETKDYYLETFIRGKYAMALNNPITRQLYLNNDIEMLKKSETQGLASITQEYSEKYLSGQPLDENSFRKGVLEIDQNKIAEQERVKAEQELQRQRENLPYYEQREIEERERLEKIETDEEARKEFEQKMDAEAAEYYREKETAEFLENEEAQLRRAHENEAADLNVRISNEAIDEESQKTASTNDGMVYVRVPQIVQQEREFEAERELFGDQEDVVKWSYIKVPSEDIKPITPSTDEMFEVENSSNLTLKNNKTYELYNDIRPEVRAGMISGRILFAMSQEAKQNEGVKVLIPPESDNNSDSQADTDRLSESIGSNEDRDNINNEQDANVPGSLSKSNVRAAAAAERLTEKSKPTVDTPYDLDYGRQYDEERLESLNNDNVNQYDSDYEDGDELSEEERNYKKSQRVEQKTRRHFSSEHESDELDKMSRRDTMESPLFSITQAGILYKYLQEISENVERFNREMEAEERETITIELREPEL